MILESELPGKLAKFLLLFSNIILRIFVWLSQYIQAKVLLAPLTYNSISFNVYYSPPFPYSPNLYFSAFLYSLFLGSGYIK
jgi:hypothetical protein